MDTVNTVESSKVTTEGYMGDQRIILETSTSIVLEMIVPMEISVYFIWCVFPNLTTMTPSL